MKTVRLTIILLVAAALAPSTAAAHWYQGLFGRTFVGPTMQECVTSSVNADVNVIRFDPAKIRGETKKQSVGYFRVRPGLPGKVVVQLYNNSFGGVPCIPSPSTVAFRL